MAVISWALPAAAPAKTKTFAKLPHLLPKPHRDLIAPVAMDVYVKGLSGKVFRRNSFR